MAVCDEVGWCCVGSVMRPTSVRRFTWTRLVHLRTSRPHVQRPSSVYDHPHRRLSFRQASKSHRFSTVNVLFVAVIVELPTLCGSHPLVTPVQTRGFAVFFVCVTCVCAYCVFCVLLQYFDTVGWVLSPR